LQQIERFAVATALEEVADLEIDLRRKGLFIGVKWTAISCLLAKKTPFQGPLVLLSCGNDPAIPARAMDSAPEKRS
jgi:hypothetical protein